MKNNKKLLIGLALTGLLLNNSKKIYINSERKQINPKIIYLL